MCRQSLFAPTAHCGGAPFVEPHEEEGDIWKGMAAFIDQILKKQ
jgi:hypothetical protein